MSHDRVVCSIATKVLLLCTVAAGCSHNPERLPELDRRFYYNLPSPEDQEAFLRVKERERQDFLEDRGLWQKWASLPEAERKAAGAGNVEVGFHEFAIFMAWGPPADTQDRDRDDRPATIHTFIRCTSGPRRGRYVRNNLDCDGTSSETQVSIQNGVVAEIRYPD
jgi:hypothetical protein